jgi:hypothetical protein
MVGRGVLLDVAGYKGADPLPVDYWITAEDLQNAAKAQNVEIRKGDILLIRTGWRKTWGEPDDSGRLDAAHTKWHRPQPGVGPDCLKFLNDTEIVAIGSDNAAVEWGFPAKPDYNRKAFGFLGLPLHVDFIWNRGAYIMAGQSHRHPVARNHPRGGVPGSLTLPSFGDRHERAVGGCSKRGKESVSAPWRSRSRGAQP